MNVGSGDPIYCSEDSLPTIADSLQAFSEKKQKIFIPGNGCNHNPNVLSEVRWRSNQTKKPIALIQKVLDRLNKAYLRPKYYFRSVNFIKDRKLRSEAREAIICLSKALIQDFDMETGVVGHYNKKGCFWGPKFRDIATRTSLAYSRACKWRAFMVEHGLLHMQTRVQRNELGQYESLPSLYQLTEKFFEELGLDRDDLWDLKNNYFKDKSKKRKLREEKSKQTVPAWPQAQLDRPRPLFDPRVPGKKEDTQSTIQAKQSIIDKAIAMHRNDPSKSISEYHKQLLHAPPS